MPLRCRDGMKKPARKSATAPQRVIKIPSENSAERDSALLRLQLCFFLSGAAGVVDQNVLAKKPGPLFCFFSYVVANVVGVFLGGLVAWGGGCSPWGPAHQKRTV